MMWTCWKPRVSVWNHKQILRTHTPTIRQIIGNHKNDQRESQRKPSEKHHRKTWETQEKHNVDIIRKDIVGNQLSITRLCLSVYLSAARLSLGLFVCLSTCLSFCKRCASVICVLFCLCNGVLDLFRQCGEDIWCEILRSEIETLICTIFLLKYDVSETFVKNKKIPRLP